ncbi:nucleotidyltransferase domain-containing protein [Halopiger goleimassiliensis]|uniref:nucleotidyltransferase domain-containing protein n=1 Tax=Halopiger goleimassiliensis TaxID=1293048 RepID=UPI0006780173|nr:nucleotidyltransferase domain-containing protein [Halopiger goleimassiliensis]
MPSVPQRVRERVDASLTRLERAYDVEVAFATARGSHAWGGAGPDSDYDVGFVSVEADRRRYAHLGGPREAIDDPDVAGEHSSADADGSDAAVDLEFQGWDVTTLARLVAESNASALDLLRSPIRYRTTYDPDPLAAYLERTYDPIELYHDWRAVARNNYRKYLSDHLVRTDDAVFPIREREGDGYRVETEDGTTWIDADDERYTETATRQTVKRNLTVCRAAMYARYLKATGNGGGHDLPALAFGQFLAEQAPDVFDADRIDLARRLLERKRDGEGDARVGDLVGHEFAHPPRRIDPDVHARDGPDRDRVNEFVDDVLEACG